ncbi:hypothetical protein J6590_010822 [Homalodisca vitripennis]|nr:hypothetical protein J6590_010822 [Homalodisca vitripennis]
METREAPEKPELSLAVINKRKKKQPGTQHGGEEEPLCNQDGWTTSTASLEVGLKEARADTTESSTPGVQCIPDCF